MSMNFGPLNRDGGERRLNVALTRSKQEMVVFTSFDHSLIDLNRTSARAIRDLKHFLDFADRGPRALAEAVQGSVGGYDSPFEEAVAKRLRDKGWEVVPQVGVSRFRIDLGIVDPDRPGDFLVGVECDGATYHRSATARDRDKVRAAVLEGLGWNLLRVWSTDWFIDQAREIEQLHSQLESILDEKRQRLKSAPHNSPALIEPVEVLGHPAMPQISAITTEAVAEPVLDAASAASQLLPISFVYQIAEFSGFLDRIKPDNFYDESYDAVLLDLIRQTLLSEAPIADGLLVQRIARAHDFKRAGRLIRERVLALVDAHFHLRQDPVEGFFVWKHEADVKENIPFRFPAEGIDARGIEDIPYEEIRAAAAHSGMECSAIEIARILGHKRLTNAGKERIDRALGL